MTKPRLTGAHRRRQTPTFGLLRNAARDGVSNFGMVTVNFGLLALLLGVFAIVTGRALGPTDRGVVVLFMTLGSMLMVAGSLGTNTYARVALVRTQDPLALTDYMGLVHVLAGLEILLAALIGGAVLYFAHSLSGPLVLVLLTSYSVLSLVSYLLRDGLYAYGHNSQASRADSTAAVMQLLLVVALWASDHMTLRNTLLAITIGQTVELLFLAVCYRRHALSLRGRYRWPWLREQILGGLPALISDFGQTMLFRLDRILLGLFSTTAVVGIYSVAATSAEALLLIPNAIAQVIFHRVASGRKQLRDLTRLRVANLVVAVATAVALAVVSPYVIDLLFGHAYHAATQPLRILVVAAVGMGAYLVDMACLNGAGRLRTASLVTMLGALLITGLDFALIPPFAATGAAIASLVAYVLAAAYAANRLQRVARDTTALAASRPPNARPEPRRPRPMPRAL